MSVKATQPGSGSLKRKRENVLWELDMLESKLSNGSSKTRLVRTKLATDRMSKKSKKQNEHAGNALLVGDDDVEVLLTKALELKRKLVQQRIYYWIKELARCLKKAKPMEIQKTVRKLKNARAQKNADGIKKLESELVIIKALDPIAVAQTHLWKRVQKNRFLYASGLIPDSPPSVADSDKKRTAQDESNETIAMRQDIIARMFKTKTVHAVSSEALEAVVSAVELANNTLDKKKRKKKDEEKLQAEVPSEIEEDSNSDDLAEFDGLIGNDSDDSEQSDNEEIQSVDYNAISEDDDETEPVVKDDEDSEYSSESPAPIRSVPQDPSPKPPTRMDKRKASSIVLPSLNVGYISPSDSDDDLFDEERNARRDRKGRAASPVQRKNRRGQRARQKIWEQKYGPKALHLKKQQEEQALKEERKQRYAAKRFPSSQTATMSNSVRLGQNDKAQKEVDSKPLHPSWEARQRISKPVDFKGKKIVFD